MEKHKTVDDYISKNEQWQDALVRLREILLSTELEEAVKWGAPIYTINRKNVVGLGAFKSYVGIWFFQGALLQDEKGKLINAQEGKTQALRQWRFNDIEEIDEKLIKAYINEAIKNQKEGREIKPVKNKPLIIPAELKTAFSKAPELKRSFDLLNLTKQREYAEYVGDAKREETRTKRLEKIIPMIRDKKGLYDKYKNC